MVEYVGFDNSLKNFAGDDGEAYWPIISGWEPISGFEDRSYVGRFLWLWEASGFEWLLEKSIEED